MNVLYEFFYSIKFILTAIIEVKEIKGSSFQCFLIVMKKKLTKITLIPKFNRRKGSILFNNLAVNVTR